MITPMLIKFLPFILMIAYGFLMMRFSVWRSRRMLDTNSTVMDDAGLLEVSRRLAGAMGVPHVRVHVLEVDPINGLAAEDGRIFLTRGFIKRYEAGEVSAEELASVIAHELGHVAHGHMGRRMVDFTGQNAVFIMLSGMLNRFLPGVGTMIARFLSSALMSRLSRRDEFEADAWATALMLKAGYGTAPQISLFRKLEKLAGMSAADVPVWMRSHPKAEERIAAITRNEARWMGNDSKS